MKIKPLLKKDYQGYRYQASYQTEYYYDVKLLEQGFQLVLKKANPPLHKFNGDELFSDWLEEAEVYGMFDDGELIGVIEGSKETWHQLFRVSNLYVNPSYQRQGVGKALLTYMIELQKQSGKYRGIILETQTCNYPAISLYQQLGFKLCRIDLYEYTNNDVDNKEARIDLILKF